MKNPFLHVPLYICLLLLSACERQAGVVVHDDEALAADGLFVAYDACTAEELWSFNAALGMPAAAQMTDAQLETLRHYIRQRARETLQKSESHHRHLDLVTVPVFGGQEQIGTSQPLRQW